MVKELAAAVAEAATFITSLALGTALGSQPLFKYVRSSLGD